MNDKYDDTPKEVVYFKSLPWLLPRDQKNISDRIVGLQFKISTRDPLDTKQEQ
jgi:hypothetical protein